jgi:lambda family phage minor tail protein L
MKNLSAALLLEKNKLQSDHPWLVCIDLTIGSDTYNFVRNLEDITFNGQLYAAFPFTIDSWLENSQGDVPQLKLQVSNVSRVIQVLIEEVSGLTGCTVNLHVINYAHLAEDYTEISLHFKVVKTECDVNWVTFYLGLPSPLHMMFPNYRYYGEHCNWTFKGVECGYGGAVAVCQRTWANCHRLRNTARFGGFLGLSRSGVRFAG